MQTTPDQPDCDALQRSTGLQWQPLTTAHPLLNVYVPSDEFAVDLWHGDLTMDGRVTFAELSLVGREFTAVGFDIRYDAPNQLLDIGFLTASFEGIEGGSFMAPPPFLGFWFPENPASIFGFAARTASFYIDRQRMSFDNMVFKTVPVPEPSTLLLFGIALAVVEGVRRQKSILG